ncbi:cytosine deaminase [Haladaptatus litoreus]|uniref:Cytosine deaminase n=1 Tax=Haladaptatus litoreus TaxID=553468 RepID=A0A1N7D1T4_9EURY|nr:cytosine deaminase [Haladaptatus litoreus]SIR69717.1 cytosine deaminase [Haladaptatus litoreus]
MNDFLVTNGTTLAGSKVDIEIRDGDITHIVDAGEGDTDAFDDDLRYDAKGRLVTPPLIEPHIHLDATGTAGDPRWNQSGTLAEGIEIWADRKTTLGREDLKERATRTVEWLVAHGITRVRTHADTTEQTLTSVEALLELREEVADIIDLQIVAFPQDGLFTDENHLDLLYEAIEMGVDVVGGIPHNEHTREDGVKDVQTAVDIAERHDLLLDLHIDETDDPQSRFTEVLASEALKRDLGSRTTASHTTAMHSYSNAYADKLINLLAESGVTVVTNPPDNAVLQGRYDSYPRRRGHTRIDQLREAGVTVGIGHDSVMDPWYHYGVGDQLDAAFILLHYAHMSGYDDVAVLWEMLTAANAEVFGATDYGLTEGTDGSLVVFDSLDPFNALRTRASRTLVLKEGRPIAQTNPAETTVYRENHGQNIDFHR